MAMDNGEVIRYFECTLCHAVSAPIIPSSRNADHNVHEYD